MIDTSELDRKEFRAAYVKLEYALYALMRVNVDNDIARKASGMVDEVIALLQPIVEPK